MRFLILISSLFIISVSVKGLLEPVMPLTVYIDPFLWWVVFWALFCKDNQTAFPAAFMGLMKDLFSTTPLGTYTILYWLIFRIIIKNREKLFIQSKIMQMLLVLIAAILANSLYALLLLLKSYPAEFVFIAERIVLIAVPTALLTLPAFFLIQILSELTGIKQDYEGKWLLPDF